MVKWRRWLGLVMLTCAVPGVWAEEGDASLRQVMQGLGQEMCRLNGAILKEDFTQAAVSAQAIAEHPRPPLGERLRIMAELGSDMPRFKRGDDAVHDSAMALKAAAERKEPAAVLEHYLHLMAGCVECHNSFRARVRALSSGE